MMWKSRAGAGRFVDFRAIHSNLRAAAAGHVGEGGEDAVGEGVRGDESYPHGAAAAGVGRRVLGEQYSTSAGDGRVPYSRPRSLFNC
jgi:hypothetical protein